MACCLCFFHGSKACLALLVPVFAVFARFSFVSALLISFSTMFFLIFSNKKPILVREIPTITSPVSTVLLTTVSDPSETVVKSSDEQEESLALAPAPAPAPQDLYSESESMDHFSSTSSEDHSSDIEWPYNMGQRLDNSDDSISDEESLFEIAIPSEQFHSPHKDSRLLSENCYSMLHQKKDFWADVNEEDNLIEIDIYMGSIKCSNFGI